MDALIDIEQRFARCDTPDEYRAIRADALRLASRVSGLEAFRARLVAADCRYWAALAEDPHHPGVQLATLARELAAIPDEEFAGIADAAPDVVEQWWSLLDVTARTMLRQTQGDTDATRAWQRLAQRIQCATPGFTFREATFGADWRRRSILAAGGLGAISMVHGDEAHGTERMVFALSLSLEGADPIDDRLTCEDVYAWSTQCWRMRPAIVVSIAQLQGVILDHLDHWRGRYRSRAGRLWVAQLFEGLVHTLQRDMAEPVLPALPESVGVQSLEPLFDLLRERLFRAAESCRSRLLLDQLAWGTRPFADLRDADAASARERVLLAMPPAATGGPAGITKEMQLMSRLPMLFWQHPRQDIGAYRRKLASIDEVEALFARQDAGLVDVDPVARLDDVMASLGEREAIIDYAIPRDTLHPAPCICIIAITRERIRHVITPLDALKEIPELHHGDIGGMAVGGREPLEVSPLGELVFQTRLAIQCADTDRAMIWLKLLHLLLVAPLARIGIRPQDFECWYLVPSGVLHSVPFRALVDADGEFLSRQVAMCVAPSVSVWLSLRRPWGEGPKRFAGLGHPRLDSARWTPLPNSEAEIRAAARLVGGMQTALFVQDAATLDALARCAPGSAILHIASHGDFPETNVMDLHQVLLTPGATDDGRLTAELMRQVDLHAAHLVVLSVCDGGLYRVGPGDELYGLVPAVFEAGASNVLTTLWSIDDAMARLWMREFYKPLVARGPAQAAKQDCEAFIADGALLRDWAGFVLVGAAG